MVRIVHVLVDHPSLPEAQRTSLTLSFPDPVVHGCHVLLASFPGVDAMDTCVEFVFRRMVRGALLSFPRGVISAVLAEAETNGLVY